ncbi:hypothetical protein KR018_007109 [Drosophila ironensis]|nr:hypothetical protein KR018_007109 [Drosophila ironensis]
METDTQTLAQTMSVEAIAAIKAKRLAMKQNKDRDDDHERSKRRQLREEQEREDEMQAEICRKAMARERQHRTCEEQLHGERELPGVLRVLNTVYDSHRRRFKPRRVDSPAEQVINPILPEPGKLCEVPVVPLQLDTFQTMKPLSKYNRYRQEHFNKEKPAFGIDPLGSNLNPKVKAKVPEKRRSQKPIIVVPASTKSLVTLHNVKQLLQEMRFVPVPRQAGPPPSDEVIIERNVKGKLLRYRVIDNVTHLNNEEWERVAAVFAMGPHWQFKGWPQRGDPANIFHRVCAFHLHFKDTPVNRDLHNLQVHSLALPQHERHVDRGILMEFWNKLDQYIALHPQQFAFMKSH